MKRRHLMEIHDQTWCPQSLRDGLTRVITFSIFCLRSYRPCADLLAAAIRRTGDTSAVDLCSGNGGPWRTLLHRLREQLPEPAPGEPLFSVALTDKFPRAGAAEFPEGISLAPESVDATAMPPSRAGFRTLFTSFHHFEPKQATAILSDAVRSESGIAIFEFTRRRPLALLPYLVVPAFVWLSLPFRRPFHWRDWAWTYPLPILPCVVFFDGVVSCLRTYSPEQCLELAKEADPDGKYEWESGVKRSLPGGMTYLIGTPVSSPNPAATATSAATTSLD